MDSELGTARKKSHANPQSTISSCHGWYAVCSKYNWVLGAHFSSCDHKPTLACDTAFVYHLLNTRAFFFGKTGQQFTPPTTERTWHVIRLPTCQIFNLMKNHILTSQRIIHNHSITCISDYPFQTVCSARNVTPNLSSLNKPIKGNPH